MKMIPLLISFFLLLTKRKTNSCNVTNAYFCLSTRFYNGDSQQTELIDRVKKYFEENSENFVDFMNNQSQTRLTANKCMRDSILKYKNNQMNRLDVIFYFYEDVDIEIVKNSVENGFVPLTMVQYGPIKSPEEYKEILCIQCEPLLIENSENGLLQNVQVDTAIDIKCRSNFLLYDFDEPLTCEYDQFDIEKGKWSNIPFCVNSFNKTPPLKEKCSPLTIENSSNAFNLDYYTVGYGLIVECVNGYEPSLKPKDNRFPIVTECVIEITNMKPGEPTWKNVVACEKSDVLKCGIFEIPHSNFASVVVHYEIETILTVICDEEYELSDANLMSIKCG
ncbi:hypothetical protein MHBO_001943, partial [Bonamia ostreae]